MKRIISFTILGLLLFNTVFADNGKVSIDIVEFKQEGIINNKIVGSFEIQNETDNYAAELFYTLSLVPKSFIDSNNRLYASSVDLLESLPQRFSLSANETKYIAFEYEVPKYLYKEDCMLILRFMDRATTFVEEAGIGVFNLGENKEFIIPSNYKETHYWNEEGFTAPQSGPYFEADEKIKGYINLKSTFRDKIAVIPEFTVYKRGKSYLDTPYQIYGDPIKFNALEEKKTEIIFPSLDEADSYLVKVVLKDKNNIPVSHEYWFRYVINGTNAKILNFSTTYLKENNNLNINLSYTGPADGTYAEDAVLILAVKEASSGNEIFSFSENIELGPSTFKLDKSFPLDFKGQELEVYAAIKYNDKILDSREVTIESKGTTDIMQTDNFIDIIGTKYENSVKMLNALGIISGYPDGSFRPENNITRAEFTAIALKISGIDINTAEDIENEFKDVSNIHWAKKTINVAYKNGIISGYGDGVFKPDNNVTYSEAITILLNVIGYREIVGERAEKWPFNYIFTASTLRIMNDVDTNSYNEPAIRGNIAIMTLQGYLNKKKI
jgi:hypothetical protein